jgi:hypothetical protein
MSIKLQEFKARVTKDAEAVGTSGKCTKVGFSTGRKPKEGDKWFNSMWFANFIGEQNAKDALKLKKGDDIIVKSASQTAEEYVNSEGKKTFPFKMVVWEWDYKDGVSAKSESDDDEGFPFD